LTGKDGSPVTTGTDFQVYKKDLDDLINYINEPKGISAPS